MPFKDKPKGPDSSEEYRNRLVSEGFTRINDATGNRILVEAVAVWDTVGSCKSKSPSSPSTRESTGFRNIAPELTFTSRNSLSCSFQDIYNIANSGDFAVGVPNMTLFSKLGIRHPGSEFKFRDTELDPSVKHAFHALALDEKRNPFSPAVWERSDSNSKSDLRQVWFPGPHSAIGGGKQISSPRRGLGMLT